MFLAGLHLVAHCHLGLGNSAEARARARRRRSISPLRRRCTREMGVTYWLEKTEAEIKDFAR
jgi:hypothetical protein